MRRATLFLLICVALLSCRADKLLDPASGPIAEPPISMVVVGNPSVTSLPAGGNASFALAINDAGLIVGYGNVATGPSTAIQVPVVWTGGSVANLPFSSSGAANDVNNAGVIVGKMSNQPARWRLVSGSYVRDVLSLGSLGTGGEVKAINDAGDMVGSSNFGKALLWPAGSTPVPQDLGFPQSAFCVASGVNASLTVVGYCNGTGQAFTWSSGVGTLLPRPPGVTFCVAEDINDAGVIVGSCGTSSAVDGAIWTNEQLTTVPRPAGKFRAVFQGINANGDISGTYAPGPFVWTTDGGFSDLNVICCPSSANAEDLNINGSVVGYAFYSGGPAGTGPAFRWDVVFSKRPTANAGGPYSTTSGVALSLDGSGSTDPEGAALTYDWDFGDSSPHGSGANPIHTYAVAGSYTITLVVTDPPGASSAAATTSVSVAQPTVLAGPVVNPANGHSYYLLAQNSWTDAEALAITLGGHLVTINDQAENDWIVTTFGNYGGVDRSLWIGFNDQGAEGSFVWASNSNSSYTNWSSGQPNNGNTSGGNAESFTHIWSSDFAHANGYPEGSWNDYLDLMLVDGTSPLNGVVEVGNSTPTANAGGPYAGNEAVPISFSAAGATDPDGDLLTYSWIFGDGVSAAGVAPSHAYADNGGYTVTLTVNDGQSSSSVTAPVNVANVAPTATFTHTGTVKEGSAFVMSLGSPLDPSPIDQAAGFTYAFDCGVGYGPFGAASSVNCPTTDNGSRTIRGTVRDKDGGAREYTATQPISNVTPNVTLKAASAVKIARGGSFSVTASFTDPGTLDAPWTVTIDWGNGTTTTTTSTQGSVTVPSRIYSQAGNYKVRMDVRDKDGGTGTSAPIQVKVQ